MQGRINHLTCILALLVVVAAPSALAAKGGNGGGKPGGGGGDDPLAAIDIVYSKPGSSGWDLWVAASDGSRESLLLAGVGDGQMTPAWSPDGTQIVFNGTVDGEGLYLVDANGANLTKVHAGSARSPDWSPDGTTIAFHAWDATEVQSDRNEVWLIAPDGSGLTQVADQAGRWEMYPRWSPDGTQLAFTVDDFSGGGWGVVVYTLAEGTEDSITDVVGSPIRDHVLEYTVADWSSDGAWVALAARKLGEKWDIWAVQVSAPANAVNVTSTSKTSEQRPSWSSDDGKIAYMDTSNSSKVMVLDLTRGRATTIDRGNSGWPDWLR